MKTILRLSLLLALLAVAILFNLGLVDVRLEEVGSLLDKVAAEQNTSKALGIVAKYELIKRRMQLGEDNIDNYELEAKIQALTSGEQYETQAVAGKRKWYVGPISLVVNGIRILMGKEILSGHTEDKVYKVLEIAYFWERNRKYTEAVRIYDEVLDKSTASPELKAAVLIHKAFCHSMLSEYDLSRRIYENIIALYPNTEAGVLSWKLIDFLESIGKERAKVEQPSGGSDFEKGKQFYLLMDYRNAIKYFSLFLGRSPAVATVPEASFYKGRSHEELGETDEAMLEYERVIRDDKSQTWAKQANRRMLMLGEFYESKKQIADAARKRLDEYHDKLFVDKVQQYTSLVAESSLREELMKQEAKTVRKDASTDSLLGLINSIGDLDLTGEKARARQEEVEKIKQELLSSGALTNAQVHEIERRSALAQNPYRRPSAIKEVIDANSNEVQYLYNKRLRLGGKLSGRMLVKLDINPNGSVSGVSVVQSNLGDREFEQQVVERIGQWRFKAVADSLGPLTVNYPFEFYKEE